MTRSQIIHPIDLIMNQDMPNETPVPAKSPGFKDSMHGDKAFPETREVLPLPLANEIEARRQRLGEIMERYRVPLRAYLMYRRNCTRSHAAELVQGFFVDRIWEKQILDQYDAQRGSRLRSFLISSLMNYVIDHERRERKRRGHANVDDVEPMATAEPPFLDAEREWGRAVLASAFTGMKDECEQKKRSQTWELFEMRVVRPALQSVEPPTYEEVLIRFQFTSPSQAYNELATAKRMFERHLRAAMTKGDESSEADDQSLAEQVENLLALFRSSSSPASNDD